MDHAAMGHGGPPKNSSMSMAMGGPSKCKISMLFNLYTTDACFLHKGWGITSPAVFAGSCIAVFLFAFALELLRRAVKEYDRLLVRQHLAKFQPAASMAKAESVRSSKDAAAITVPPLRPSFPQQVIRAFLHLLQFTCAYILMLLAMYYNGYLLLCIVLGIFLGAFIFQWENLSLGGQQTSAVNEATVCCG